MTELLRSTSAYRLFRADAQRGNVAHTTLILFPDEVYLSRLLSECAAAFFADEGERAARLAARGAFADCIYLPADGKYTVESAAYIIDESALRPVEGEKKLFVLTSFHTASALVQNKLLKVFEEPPEGAYFLLGATAEHAVLPTVLSRAKRLAAQPFSEEAIAAALAREHPGETGAREAAAACGGVYSVAEQLLAGRGESFRLAEEFLRAENVEAVCRAIGERKDRSFFAALRLVLRDVMFLSSGEEAHAARRSESMRALAREYPAGVAVAAIGFAADAERELQFNANAGQAALALAARIREEKKKWKLS